jgi:hypothetical protein
METYIVYFFNFWQVETMLNLSISNMVTCCMSLTNFTASLIGRAVILVIMYVELYVTDKLHSESNRMSCDPSDNVCRTVCHWQTSQRVLIGRAVILVIMYVELYVTDKLHSESNRTSCDTSDNVCRAVCHWQTSQRV